MALPPGLSALFNFKGPKGDKGDKGDVGTISTMGQTMLPADEAAYVVMSGPDSARHAQLFTPRGLPGVNAVENDEAVSVYVGAKETATAAAVDLAAATPANIVCDGDSLTFGVGAPWLNYPQQLTAGLPGGSRVRNFGVGGQNAAQMLADANTQVDAAYSDAFRHNVVVAMIGINSIYQQVPVADIYADIVSYHQGRRTAGFKTVVLTVLPATGNNPPASVNADIASLNTMIRNGWEGFADAIADVAADPVFATAGVTLDTTFYHLDQVHLAVRGYGIVADVVRAALARIGVSARESVLTEAVGEWSMVRAERKANGNVRIGYRAGETALPASLNVAIGDNAGALLSTGSTGNTLIGAGAGVNAYQNAVNNTVIGSAAGRGTTGQYLGSRGTLIGSAAGNMTTGNDNTAIGYRSLLSNGIGLQNVAVGSETLYSGNPVSQSVAIGFQALRETTASYNVAIGFRAGHSPAGDATKTLTTGQRNTFVGHESGAMIGTASNVVAVGYQATAQATGNAVGSNSKAGAASVAVGHTADASANYATAVGGTSKATHAGGVAIGVNSAGVAAATNAVNDFVLGTTSHRYRMPGLPTTNPGAGSGILWANNGVVTVA